MARPRLARQRSTSRALLLRRVPYSESDLVVGLYCEQLGAVSALARNARRSTRRFGALEPLHLLRVSLDFVSGRELATLTEATVERARLSLTGLLEGMQAAGQALRWLRKAAPHRVRDPRLWLEINALLDALGDSGDGAEMKAILAAGGLRMLEAAGWGLELGRCVRCDRPVPTDRRVRIDVGAGGVVCRRCGGGPLELSADQRERLVQALGGDERALGAPADTELALSLVDRAFALHGRGV